MKLARLKSPNTFLIIFLLLILCAGLTWVIPSGAYETKDVNGKNTIIPDSFHYTESNPQGISEILMAPLRGFVDAALIIGFVLLVGGAFYVFQRTKAMDAAIKSIARAHKTSRFVQIFTIPIFMTMFSLAGAIFGMSEEVIPFVLLFVPLALALGYDTVTGVAIPFIGAGAGFAGAFINPFTLGVAQGIAELPPLSGFEYRVGCWFIITLVAILYVSRYAKKVKQSPELSFMFEKDQADRAQSQSEELDSFEGLTTKDKLVLITFALGLVVLVIGVLRWGWYIEEISAVFFLTGILVGIAGRLKVSEITDSFVTGARDLIGTGLIIAMARGILIIAQDGQIIDTILQSLSKMVGELHPVLAGHSMFVIQTFINFFVPSGSGQAAMTMPIMAPLADLVGIGRQTAVLAFQFGDGFSNLIIPTSAVTMGILALGKIPWEKWARWILPLELLFLLVGLLLLIPPYFFKWM